MIQWILRVQIQQRRNLILQTSFFLMMMIIMMIRVFLTLQIPLFTIGKPQAEVENIIKQITRESLVAPINQNSQYFERMEKIKYSSYPLSFMFHSSHITSVTNQISDELRSLLEDPIQEVIQADSAQSQTLSKQNSRSNIPSTLNIISLDDNSEDSNSVHSSNVRLFSFSLILFHRVIQWLTMSSMSWTKK